MLQGKTVASGKKKKKKRHWTIRKWTHKQMELTVCKKDGNCAPYFGTEVSGRWWALQWPAGIHTFQESDFGGTIEKESILGNKPGKWGARELVGSSEVEEEVDQGLKRVNFPRICVDLTCQYPAPSIECYCPSSMPFPQLLLFLPWVCKTNSSLQQLMHIDF